MTTLVALRDQPFQLLRELDDRIRAARLDAANTVQDIWSGLGIRVRERTFVIPQHEIREVIAPLPLVRVPKGPGFLMGICNVRGTLEPVNDLGLLMGEKAIDNHRRKHLVVLNSRFVPAAFMVDEVLGYRQFVPTDQCHEWVGQAGEASPYLLGAFTREAQVWLVLSLHRVVRSAAFLQASS